METNDPKRESKLDDERDTKRDRDERPASADQPPPMVQTPPAPDANPIDPRTFQRRQ